jgi:hypothetical protein
LLICKYCFQQQKYTTLAQNKSDYTSQKHSEIILALCMHFDGTLKLAIPLIIPYCGAIYGRIAQVWIYL